MFGTRESFTYYECAACRSLSIADVPADLGRHYPASYYSFATADRRPRIGGLARRLAVATLLHMPATLSERLPARMSLWRGMGKASVRTSTRILDVGCGNGALLRSLKGSGFTDLTGVDPFLERGSTGPNITLIKGQLVDLDGSYGFILLSHSLEHMPDPRAALHEVARLCAPGGHVLIGVPVLNRSWAELGPDWIGLDPPRHLFIPSISGLSGLIDSIPGLRLREMWFDTNAFEFCGSSLVRDHIPLHDEVSGTLAPERNFDKGQLAAWSKMANEYNRRGEGGTASFLVEKS